MNSPNCSTGFSSWNTKSFTKISTTTTSAWTQYRVSAPAQRLQWVHSHQPGLSTHTRHNQDKSPWGFYSSPSFPQRPELDINQDKSPWGFYSSPSFPQRPDLGHQPSRDRDKLYSISMRQVSNIWKSFNATLSDSNPSHAPQSRVSVKETDFVNGRNMLNWTV